MRRQLQEVGVDWEAFADGKREEMLDRLERLAGKEDVILARQPARRTTRMASIDLAAPLPCSPSSSRQASTSTILPPLRHRATTKRIYQDILASFTIVTIDLKRLDAGQTYVDVASSPWATNGPAHFLPSDPVYDDPFLGGSTSSVAVERDVRQMPSKRDRAK